MGSYSSAGGCSGDSPDSGHVSHFHCVLGPANHIASLVASIIIPMQTRKERDASAIMSISITSTANGEQHSFSVTCTEAST